MDNEKCKKYAAIIDKIYLFSPLNKEDMISHILSFVPEEQIDDIIRSLKAKAYDQLEKILKEK